MFVSFHGWLTGTRLVTTDLYRFCENWAFCLTDRGESWGAGVKKRESEVSRKGNKDQ